MMKINGDFFFNINSSKAQRCVPFDREQVASCLAVSVMQFSVV